jgi:hypothetical protein
MFDLLYNSVVDSVESVINWPPGSGSDSLIFIKVSKKFLKKVQYFIIYNLDQYF